VNAVDEARAIIFIASSDLSLPIARRDGESVERVPHLRSTLFFIFFVVVVVLGKGEKESRDT
jgi:hypothetical protein